MFGAQINIAFVVLCVPAILPAAFFYAGHCKRTPRGENRFPLALYIVLLLICAVVAFWAGVAGGIAYACSGLSAGNLCGLLGPFVIGPLSSIIAVTVLSWLLTRFPIQMKRIGPVGAILVLLGGLFYAYQSRNLPFHEAAQGSDVVNYKLQSDNVDDLRRYAMVIETRLRGLPVVKDVWLDSELKNEQAVVGVDPQKPGTAIVRRLPTMTMTFSLMPNISVGDAINVIRETEKGLALPPTIKTSLARGK